VLSEKSVKANRAILAASLSLVATLLILPFAEAQQYKMEAPSSPSCISREKQSLSAGVRSRWCWQCESDRQEYECFSEAQ
jgi:hypothetical protein